MTAKSKGLSLEKTEKTNHTNPIQQTNWRSERLFENKHYEEFVNWWTDLHTQHSSFVVALCAHPITFQGCCTRLLGFGTVQMNRDYVVPYVRQLKERIPALTCLPFQCGGSVKTSGAGEVGGPAQGGTGWFCFCPNISAVLLHFWRLMSGCFCTSQMQKELIFSSKTKTKTQSKTLQQLFFNANACLFHALKPFSPGCLWQTFHNRLFKVWHMCQC